MGAEQQFKLDKDKFKILYQFFMEAEVNNSYCVGKADYPVS